MISQQTDTVDQQMDAVVEDVENWLFKKYLPTWASVGADSDADPRKVLDYWGVPMHAATPKLNQWLATEDQVLSSVTRT